ncbi:hypothetical protein [Ottowia sp.]|uniref:hypothetical protein n=1 Tax=Ottowia sp. TaxID=1898956 RepID=UPI0026005E29|nr:hypothetical protein [Ottowia sp.]MBK6616090.1 hypothetical protein [Ottowia sp.]
MTAERDELLWKQREAALCTQVEVRLAELIAACEKLEAKQGTESQSDPLAGFRAELDNARVTLRQLAEHREQHIAILQQEEEKVSARKDPNTPFVVLQQGSTWRENRYKGKK